MTKKEDRQPRGRLRAASELPVHRQILYSRMSVI